MQQGSGQEDTERAEETMERLNRIRQQFADTVEILHMAPRAKAGEYVDHLYDFLEQNQVQQKLLNYQQRFEQEGDLAKAREYAQIYCWIKSMNFWVRKRFPYRNLRIF